MSLIELWRKKVTAGQRLVAVARDSELHETTLKLEGSLHARKECIADFTDATTPRKPEPEWFGTGPGQWPAWWVKAGRYRTILNGCRVRWNGSVPAALRSDNATDIPWEDLEVVIPVAREGYPAPVGWQVVGGKS